MRTRGIVFALSLLAFLTLGGCNWYLTDDGYYYDDDSSWFCEGDQCWECEGNRCWPVGDNGFDGVCTEDADCAEGCYCVEEEGYCEETGFCDRDDDCFEGFECDERNTCVPTTPTPGCESNEDCDAGQTCSDAGTCEPTQCQNNGDCPDGSVCDILTGECVPGEPDDPGACDGEITCDALPPTTCRDGEVPGIADGCWTGGCVPRDECEETPRKSCEELRTDEELLECRDDRRECLRTTVTICTPNDDAPAGTDCRDPQQQEQFCECREADQCRTREPGEAPFASTSN